MILTRDFETQTDSIEELTKLLNRSYQTLADMGFRFVAASQDSEMTAKRMATARTIVGLIDGKLVATVSYYPPSMAKGTPWYDLPHVAKFGQFAVDIAYRRQGLGDMLIRSIEEMASNDGATELALDTAEGASHLIKYYSTRGYRFVDYVQWRQTNYRSVIMSKTLHQA